MRKLVVGMLMVLVGLAISGLGGCGQECCMEEIALLSHDVGSDKLEAKPDQAMAKGEESQPLPETEAVQQDLPAMQVIDGIAAIPDVTELEADIAPAMEKGCDLDGPSSFAQVDTVEDAVAVAEVDMPEQGQEDFTILEMDTVAQPVEELAAADVTEESSDVPQAPQLSILEAVAESQQALESLQEMDIPVAAEAVRKETPVAEVAVVHNIEATSETAVLPAVPGIESFNLGADVVLPETQGVVSAPVMVGFDNENIMSLAPGDNESIEDNMVEDLPEMSEIAGLFEASTDKHTNTAAAATVKEPRAEVEISQPEIPEVTEEHAAVVTVEEKKEAADESWQQAMLEFDEGVLQLEEQAPVIAAETEDAAPEVVAAEEEKKVEDGELLLDEARGDAAADEGVKAAEKGADVVDQGMAESEASVDVARDNAVAQDKTLLDEAAKIQNQEDKQLSASPEAESKINDIVAMEKIRREARLAQARNLVSQGKELYAARQYTEALKAFDKALQIDPEVADVRELRERTRALVGKTSSGGDAALMDELVRSREARLRERELSINNNLEQASNYYIKAISPDNQRRTLTRTEQIKAGLEDLDSAQVKVQAANTLLQGAGLSMAMEKTLSLRVKALMAQISDSRKALTQEQGMIDNAEAQSKAQAASSQAMQVQTNQIEALFKSAVEKNRLEDFDGALETVEKIQQLDPNNVKAEQLKQDIRAKSHVAARSKNDIELKHAEDNWDLDVKESYILPRKVLIYPLDWERIKQRSKLSRAGKVADFEKQKLMNQLSSVRVPVEYADLPLNLVLNDFRNRAKVNIMLDKDVDPEMPITISLRGVSLLTVFEQILEANDLQYRVRNQAIEVYEKGSVGSSEYTLRIYQVADLINPMKNYYAPKMLNSSGDGWGGDDDDDDDDDDEDEWETEPINLPEQIRNFVPADWENEMAAVDQWEDNLLVRQTPEVHAKINGYLDKLRESAKLQVLVEGRFMDITDNFLEAIGFDWSSAYATANNTGNQQMQTGATITPASSPSANYYYGYPNNSGEATLGGMTSNLSYLWSHSPVNYLLNSLSLNVAFNASEKTEKGSVLHNPKVLVANGRNAYAQVVVVTPYMTNYTLSGTRFLPVMTDIYQGVTWDARPIISFDRKYITIRVRPQIQNINDNYTGVTSRNVTISIVDDNTVYQYPSVTLTNPVTQITQFETNATVPDGGTVLIGGMLKDANSDSISGVPVLSSIPRIGRLFRTEYNAREGSNRVIMVSAKIVELED